MTARCIEGFESGILSPNATSAGTFSIQSSVARTGTYAARFNNSSVQTGRMRFGDFSADGATATAMAETGGLYAGFYFRADTLPTGANGRSICTFRIATPIDQLRIILLGSGVLAAYNITTLLATGATVLTAGNWYRIGVQANKGTVAPWEVQINGATEISGTANLTAVNIDFFAIATEYTVGSSEAVDYYYDDIIVKDDGFPPDGKIILSVPSGAGSANEWTTGTNGSDWNECKEVPPDGGTTYVKCDTTNADADERVSFAMQDFAVIGGTGTQINAVQAVISVREDTSVTSANKLRFANGATFTTTAFNHNTTYAPKGVIYALNPNTSTAWTPTTFNTVQLGSTEGNAVSMRMDIAHIQVHFTPPVDTKPFFGLAG